MQLPDAVFTQLRHMLDMEEGVQWGVGDFILDVWTELSRFVSDEDRRKEHANMINQMASKTGADKSTLRSRENMSKFYSPQDRVEYDMFTYHQFRALRKAGDNWREIAEWAKDGGWNNGMATIDEIRAKIDGEQDSLDLTRKRLDALERKIRVILDDNATPPNVREALVLIPTILQDAKELL